MDYPEREAHRNTNTPFYKPANKCLNKEILACKGHTK
jgi:hypothetical protein